MERELKTLKGEDSFNKLRSRFDNLRKKTPLLKVPSYNELAERFERLKELKKLKDEKNQTKESKNRKEGKKNQTEEYR